jgi:hypothetical protein
MCLGFWAGIAFSLFIFPLVNFVADGFIGSACCEIIETILDRLERDE